MAGAVSSGDEEFVAQRGRGRVQCEAFGEFDKIAGPKVQL